VNYFLMFQLHDRFCMRPIMGHFGGRMGAIWHILALLPFSSYSGWKAVSFEYLHGRFCKTWKIGHFWPFWGKMGGFLGESGRIFGHF